MTEQDFLRAAFEGDLRRLLIEHGADPNGVNAAGERPIDIARAKKKPKIVAALEA
jgi:hypothetical protein